MHGVPAFAHLQLMHLALSPLQPQHFLELAIGYWTPVQTLSVGGCAIVAAGSLLFDLTLVCKAIDADG